MASSDASTSAVRAVQLRINGAFAGKEPWAVCRDTLVAVGALYAAIKIYNQIRRKGLKKALLGALLNAAKNTSAGRAAIEKDTKKTIAKLSEIMKNKEAANDAVLTTIPAQGMSAGKVLQILQRWKECEDKRWKDGQVSGGIYHGGDELVDFLSKVYGLFFVSNPLHPDVFPFVRKMECEVVRMTVSLFNGGPEACGTMTSGGTESILMAVKSYRDEARSRGIEEAHIVVPVSAHAAFDKAAHYFSMQITHVPVDPVTMRADVAAMKKAIRRNTVLLVGSAPGFPHGVVDPIEDLAQLAKERGIGLHVDGCLGGYLLPFAAKLNYPIPPFDFRVDGVTSISADTHKYGYAPKGASVVMYSNNRLRSFQYFVAPEWTGGIYASPSMPGSRPGGTIAATWAALVRIGENGYLECAKAIMSTAKEIEAGIRQIPGLKVLGKPDMSVIAFTSDPETKVRGQTVNIYKVGECMTAERKSADGSVKHGWNLNTLQKPSAIHLCCTYMHRGRAQEFLSDLRKAVDEVVDHPEKFRDGTAAIYGMAESIPDGTIIENLAKGFIDTLYTQ